MALGVMRYSGASDFFPSSICGHRYVNYFRRCRGAHETLGFLIFALVMTGFIYPMEGSWTWGSKQVFGLFSLGDLGFSDFAGSGIVHMAERPRP